MPTWTTSGTAAHRFHRIVGNTRQHLLVALLMASVATGTAPGARAETVIAVENFTSTASADTAATTALWDTATGQLSLHPQGLATIGSLALPGTAYAAAWRDSFLILANGPGNALLTISAGDPTQPSLSHSHPLTANARHLTLNGSWGYVALGSGLGVQVVDLTNPLAPVSGPKVTLGSFTGQSTVVNNWLYAAAYNGGVGVIEITDPANPVAMPNVGLSAWVRYIATDNSHLYLAADNTLTVMGLTNPAAPDSQAVLTTSGIAYCVTALGTWAYVGGPAGIDIIDISQPTTPALVSNISLGGGAAYQINVRGDSLFVANGNNGLSVVNIVDPALPVVVANHPSGDYYYHTVLRNGDIWASHGAAGLQVLRADPQGLDPARNLAVSQNLNPGGDPVTRARLSAVYADSIRFEITGDGGSTWLPITPDDSWVTFSPEGGDLRWRAFLIQTGPAPGPVCQQLTLTFQRRHSYAEIISASDIPADTGGKLRLQWRASRHDAPGGTPAITEYSVYRRFSARQSRDKLYPPGSWEYLLTVPADQETLYAATVATIADSAAQNTHWNAYFVRARTATVGAFFDSPVDSGYSVNNLAPLPPTGFSVSRTPGVGAQLTWDAPADPSFAHFRVYRSLSPSVVPAPASLYYVTTGTTFFDATTTSWYYQLTMVNLSGQESPPAVHATATPVLPAPAGFSGPNTPNPFNPATQIRYVVPPGGRRIYLAVFDVRGRLVATLVDRFVPEGPQTVRWRGRDQAGRNVASGVYSCQLRYDGQASTINMTLVR